LPNIEQKGASLSPNQALTRSKSTYLIKPFQWEDWNGLWQLRTRQLAEEGIMTDGELPEKPDLSSPYEQDYHRIDQVYLAARGNFWIAWMDALPVGHIGAEDKGDHVELRRMYVRSEYRRHGIGTLLVQALIKHCIEQKVGIVELWTANDGPGRFLYEKLGFRQVEIAGEELDGTTDDNNEIRMRLALTDLSTAGRGKIKWTKF
jgi:GNAT superfamily N-acetyltransferase